MRRLLGFLAQNIGFSCSSTNSKSFKDGWLIGAGLRARQWLWKSKPFGKNKWQFVLFLHSRRIFKTSFSRPEINGRKITMLNFGYGVFLLRNILEE